MNGGEDNDQEIGSLAEPDREFSQAGLAVPLALDDAQLQALIAAIVDRDQDALAKLYDILLGRIYGFALRITRRATLAEEVAEDTFWQIWRQAPRFDPERGSAIAWIMTIARSRALDALRALDPIEPASDSEDLLEQLPCAAAGPDAEADAMQQADRLHELLEQLDPQPRRLILLAFFHGLTHEEIAAASRLPLGTVKTTIRRTMVKLRQILTNHGGFDGRHS